MTQNIVYHSTDTWAMDQAVCCQAPLSGILKNARSLKKKWKDEKNYLLIYH